jgi:hypothetical protein
MIPHRPTLDLGHPTAPSVTAQAKRGPGGNFGRGRYSSNQQAPDEHKSEPFDFALYQSDQNKLDQVRTRF